jgi:hypothetical protein
MVPNFNHFITLIPITYVQEQGITHTLSNFFSHGNVGIDFRHKNESMSKKEYVS